MIFHLFSFLFGVQVPGQITRLIVDKSVLNCTRFYPFVHKQIETKIYNFYSYMYHIFMPIHFIFNLLYFSFIVLFQKFIKHKNQVNHKKKNLFSILNCMHACVCAYGIYVVTSHGLTTLSRTIFTTNNNNIEIDVKHTHTESHYRNLKILCMISAWCVGVTTVTYICKR